MSCEFASLRTNIERTLERTGHLVAGIAGEIEGDVILFAVPGHGYRTTGDAGIARHGIVFHADVPGAARKLRVGESCTAAHDISLNELVCNIFYVCRSDCISTLRKDVNVVVIFFYGVCV